MRLIERRPLHVVLFAILGSATGCVHALESMKVYEIGRGPERGPHVLVIDRRPEQEKTFESRGLGTTDRDYGVYDLGDGNFDYPVLVYVARVMGAEMDAAATGVLGVSLEVDGAKLEVTSFRVTHHKAKMAHEAADWAAVAGVVGGALGAIVASAVVDGDSDAAFRAELTGQLILPNGLEVPISAEKSVRWRGGGEYEAARRAVKGAAELAAHNALAAVPLPLVSSVRAGDLPAIHTLLTGGASVDAINPSGDTALLAAVRLGRSNLVALLVGHSDAIDRTDRHGQTALMVAAEHGHLDVLTQLMAAAAAPDVITQDGETALMLAARAGQSAAIERLLLGGADPALRNRRGHSAQRIAADAGHPEAAALLPDETATPVPQQPARGPVGL